MNRQIIFYFFMIVELLLIVLSLYLKNEAIQIAAVILMIVIAVLRFGKKGRKK